MKIHEDLAKRLRLEAQEWCKICCYKQSDSSCVAPANRKNDCDIYTKLQAADTIESLALVCRVQRAALANMPKWISVEERLPETGKSYIVYRHSEKLKEEYTTIAVLTSYGEWSLSGVTHYMSLPEPPNEEQHG